jgi:hypothetical protein
MVSASLLYAADPRPIQIDLTPVEKAYLAEKKEITMCVDPDWEPFEIIDEEGRARRDRRRSDRVGRRDG